MKYFKLTYYLLFICIVAASCSMDDSIIPDQTGEEVRVQLTIQFPEAATRATPEGTENERNISNLHLYVFEDNGISYRFKEEAHVSNIGGADESGNRTITGILSEGYSNGIKLVALANLENKGLDFFSLPVKETPLADFYKTLKYTRANDTNQWPDNGNDQLPMWGECDMKEAPKPGLNTGSLSLTRAVAKVEVMVMNGNALNNGQYFKMTKIEVYQYNDRGFCTTPNLESPNVPSDVAVVDAPLVYELSEREAYLFRNRLYIPEQINSNVNDNRKVFLKLTAEINEARDTKEFNIPFKKNGKDADFDILRNNVYVFNITSVKTDDKDIAEITLSYKVIEWREEEIEIGFN